jgi:hypothetical protein
LSDADVLQAWEKDATGNPVFAQIISNLAADSRIDEKWTIDDVVEVLFGPSETPQMGTVLEEYIRMYSKHYEEDKKLSTYVVALQQLVDLYADASNMEAIAETLLGWLDDTL